MGIEAKRRGWNLGEINIDVHNIMTSVGPRGIELITLDIFMQKELDSDQFHLLKRIADDYPVKLNFEHSIEIQMNWN